MTWLSAQVAQKSGTQGIEHYVYDPPSSQSFQVVKQIFHPVHHKGPGSPLLLIAEECGLNLVHIHIVSGVTSHSERNINVTSYAGNCVGVMG